MIVFISDTHENLPIIRKALPLIRNLRPELVIHCGDIISPPTVEEFAGLPMRFVFGNNDGERAGLKAKCRELGFGEIDDDLKLTIGDKDLYVLHGTRASTVEQVIDSQVYDYVVHGHTHRQRDEKIGRTRAINPGALFQAAAYSFASLDPVTDTLTFYEVEKL